MGLFDKIFQPFKNKQSHNAIKEAESYFKLLSSYRPSFYSWQGCIYESELIRASIDGTARMAAKAEVDFQGKANRRLLTLLKYKPNEFQTWYQFIYRTVTILETFNTCFIVPVLDDRLEITGYFPVIPERVEIIQYKSEPWLKYRFNNGQTAAVEFNKCGVLTKHQLYSDFFGEGNIRPLESTLDVMKYAKDSVKTAVENANGYHFIAQVLNWTKVEDLKKERKRFTEANLLEEEDNKGLLLFPNTYKDIKQVEASTFTVDEKQQNLIKNNVFSYFGTNENLLQGKATKEELEAFFIAKIEPVLLQLSQVMTDKIFTMSEKSNGNSVEFKQRYSLKEKTEFLKNVMLVYKYMADYQSVTGERVEISLDGEMDIQKLLSGIETGEKIEQSNSKDSTEGV